MLPFPCSTCDIKSIKNCIIPDTASLSYTMVDTNKNCIGVNFTENDTKTGKIMHIIPISESGVQVPTTGEELTPNSCITAISQVSSGDLSMQITSIDYHNTSDGADGSFVVAGTVTCPKGSYTMNLTATWAFEEVPPTPPIPTVEESKSGS